MVERMTLILDAFEPRTVRLPLEDIARRTRLPRSTVHRIVGQLVAVGWLRATGAGYTLGSRAFDLGGRARADGALRAAAAPLLHDLQVATGMVVHLAVLAGGEVHYLDRIGGRGAGTVPSRVGGRAPAHATALGKAVLARLEPEEVEAVLGDRLPRATPRTVGDLGTLHQELHRIRRRGLAFEWGEYAPGTACVAAAVRGPDGPAGAVSAAGPARGPVEAAGPLVFDAARRIEDALFPQAARHRSRRRVRTAA
ncbi:IclR family transcriptional regulator [Nocardiopsis coralliicola]